MSLFSIFDIAGSGMSAQSVRLNTTSSNLANAETVSSSAAQTYRARQPVFSAVLNALNGGAGSAGQDASSGVQVLDIVESKAPIQSRYEPNNPQADARGYVYLPNVNMVEEMANMISASRSYQSNAEVINTSKQMLLKTLSLGQ
ncbi:MAG: flagellar basal body rod protein FlgC [Gammaproteobacteria bacterium]|nr:flagellar basal body rod protein FlgC [Gammaproteobacteria bacterium]